MNCTHVEMKVSAYRQHLERKLDTIESEMANLEVQRTILEVDLEEKEVMALYEIQVGASNLLASQFIEDMCKVETNKVKAIYKALARALTFEKLEWVDGFGYVHDPDDLIKLLEGIVTCDELKYSNLSTVRLMSEQAGLIFDESGKIDMYYVANRKLEELQSKISKLNKAYAECINMIETLKQISATTKINVAIQDL